MANNKLLCLMILGWVILTAACSEAPSRIDDHIGGREPTASGPASTPAASGPYFGLEGGDTPQVLLPGFISTTLYDLNGTSPPDGREFFFTAGGGETIVHTRLQTDGSWSAPEIAPFSGWYEEFDPLFSPDGERLYFSSRRPADNDTSENGVASNLWFVERAGDSWGEPRPVSLPIDTDRGNFYSSLTHDGDIYFNKNHPGYWSDIHRAVKTEEGYEIERLSDAVNYRGTDADPFVSPDGDYLIFRSNRPGGVGRADLWISFNVDGEWTEAQNLGAPINSPATDYCPFVTFDGRFLIFTSERFIETFHADTIGDFDDMLAKSRGWDNGRGNLYWVSTDFLDELRPSAAR
ncbi:MAG: hypothetical protein MPN21_20315 [Thermoanaerobaculia bacterium]|nr:hypothetical protein [Thermoanaerobaculia bacterium]